MAPGEGWSDNRRSSFASPPPGQSTDGHHLACVETTSAQPILKLHWPREIGQSHPMSPPYTAHKSPLLLLTGSLPHPAPLLGQAFLAGNHPQLTWPMCSLHISGEAFGGGPPVSAQASVSLGQIVGVYEPDTDGSWPRCDL